MNMTSRPTEKDIPRQRWLRIIPPILITCIISDMDRVNTAFAMPGGMDAELGISATMAGLAGGIFFIGYLFLTGSRRQNRRSRQRQEIYRLVAGCLGGYFRPHRLNHQPVSIACPAFLTGCGGRRHAARRTDDDQQLVPGR